MPRSVLQLLPKRFPQPSRSSLCGIDLQRNFLEIVKYKNSKSANPLRTLLTACNMPQRASSRSVSADRLSSAGLSHCLLMGRITISVNGITEPSSTPQMPHKKDDPASHAAVEETSPTAARLACMTAARR